jgi:hypothetical protein
MSLHGERKRKGLDSLPPERGCHLLNHRFVIEGRIRIRGNVRWFRWIDAGLAMDSVELFR